MKIFSCGTCATVVLFAAAAIAQTPHTEKKTPGLHLTHTAMACEFDFLLFGNSPDDDPQYLRETAQPVFDMIDALENRLSNWIPESPVSAMNREAAKQPFKVDADLFSVMQTARRFYDDTNGVFDVSVGPLLKMWGFYGKQGGEPTPEEIKKSLDIIGMNRVTLNKEAQTVKYERDGMRIDFGGIGKGMALDHAENVLKQQGIRDARLHAGTSTIVAWGNAPNLDGWKITIRDPFVSGNEERPPVAEIVIHNESLSTSSGSERHVTYNGKKFCHIFDPRNGMPVDNGVKSATAIAPTGTESDVLSTAFYVLGPEGAKEYCEKHPEVRALFVMDRDGKPEVVKVNFSVEPKPTPAK